MGAEELVRGVCVVTIAACPWHWAQSWDVGLAVFAFLILVDMWRQGFSPTRRRMTNSLSTLCADSVEPKGRSFM